jgi:pimeloyl-ACP methyl ester carboxylesterase
LGPPYFHHQSEWYREAPFVSERKGLFVFIMEELFIKTEFGTVFGKSAGRQGDPLLLGIHGYSQRNGWQTWEPLMPPPAEAGYWVVSLDMPGWGQSVSQRPLQNGDFLHCVLQVLDELGAETAVLLGKSWGGGIALEAALQHPERISKLILTAPARMNIEPLAELQQPVLLAWAEDDQVIPYSYAAKYVATVPHIQLESYPTGGHSAAQKNVADFAPKAIKFLGD